MRIIERINENIYTENITIINQDYVSLKHDELVKNHRRLKTFLGEEIALSLPSGSIIKDGDVLYREGDKVVYVSLEKEKIIHIIPEVNLDWARAAYAIGNMHMQASLKKDGIYILYDEAIEKTFSRLNIKYKIKIDKIEGDRINAKRRE